jgi:hypothetical protein
MSVFGFLGSKKTSERQARAVQTVDLKPIAAQDPRPSMAGSEAIAQRVGGLRHRLHTHLLATSRDYAVLTSLKSSKIEYCNKVTQEVTKRLASNPFFEVLQHLDDAHSELKRSGSGGGR